MRVNDTSPTCSVWLVGSEASGMALERKENQMSSIVELVHGVWANDYHFKNTSDLATAALVRAVLGDLDEAARRELLDRIVSPEMRKYIGGSTVEARQVSRNIWTGVNKDLIADMINKGKSIDTSKWKEVSHNKAYKKTVKFLKYDFLPNIDGAEYVKEMPDELARFLTDCWLAT